MRYVWKFNVQNRPSKEKDGITNVSQDFTLKDTVSGDVIPVGSIIKSRGNASYVALDLGGARIGEYKTRSQAAHALRKLRVANLPTADAAVEAGDAGPAIVEPETSETDSTVEDLGGEAA